MQCQSNQFQQEEFQMTKSVLFGRRVHISGRISECIDDATTENVNVTRNLVGRLVKECMEQGANFVVPVDAEPLRSCDDTPICFDWLIWETIFDNLHLRPSDAIDPIAIGVMHEKNPNQIPECKSEIWDKMSNSQKVHFVQVGNWDMNAVRLTEQAKLGDILLTLGGGEGVIYLANIYINRGKPVIPLDLPISAKGKGTQAIIQFGLTNQNSDALFKVTGEEPVKSCLTKLQKNLSKSHEDQIKSLMSILNSLKKPKAFAIRLLNTEHKDYSDVNGYFESVIRHVIENELNYELVMLNDSYKHSGLEITSQIFQNLHRSSLIIADLTGERPNCFLELGYALRHQVTTLITKQEHKEEELPFDIGSYPSLFWTPNNVEEERLRLLKYYNSIADAEPLVLEQVIIPS